MSTKRPPWCHALAGTSSALELRPHLMALRASTLPNFPQPYDFTFRSPLYLELPPVRTTSIIHLPQWLPWKRCTPPW